MSEESIPAGSINWRDLTVADADGLCDFYEQVVGWQREPFDMGGYQDYCMKDADGTVVAGICHAKGANEGVPPQWLPYITVTDIASSIESCKALGGKLLHGPRNAGGGDCAVIQDPRGAVVGLYQG